MKKIIMIFMILLLSGCSVNYKLKINNDLSLEENILVTTNASYFESLGPVESVYINTIDLGMADKGYNYIHVADKGNYGVNATKNFTSLDDFKSSSNSYKEIYDDIEIIQENNIVTINSVGNFKTEKFISQSEDDSSDDLSITNSYIAIEIPFEVLNSNADRVSKQDNIYYWDIDNNITKDKTIQISFDTNKKFISIKKILNNMGYTFFTIIAIIVIAIVSYNKIKTKHIGNNKI